MDVGMEESVICEKVHKFDWIKATPNYSELQYACLNASNFKI